MSASFVRIDSSDELGSVQLVRPGESPSTVERDGAVYALERIADGPLAVYLERRPAV